MQGLLCFLLVFIRSLGPPFTILLIYSFKVDFSFNLCIFVFIHGLSSFAVIYSFFLPLSCIGLCVCFIGDGGWDSILCLSVFGLHLFSLFAYIHVLLMSALCLYLLYLYIHSIIIFFIFSMLVSIFDWFLMYAHIYSTLIPTPCSHLLYISITLCFHPSCAYIYK